MLINTRKQIISYHELLIVGPFGVSLLLISSRLKIHTSNSCIFLLSLLLAQLLKTSKIRLLISST